MLRTYSKDPMIGARPAKVDLLKATIRASDQKSAFI